jgi:uncharacterized protein (TIGR02996 family)
VSSESELLDALRRDPADVETLMVYADALLTRGDSRGELIMLQYRDHATPGGLVEPAALERFLELTAEHGFLVLPDDPDAGVLRFRGGMFPLNSPTYVDYRVRHAGREYWVWYDLRHHQFRLLVDEVDVAGPSRPAGYWMAEETNVTLAIISEAIVTGQRFDELEYPTGAALRAHPHYGIGRCPVSPIPRELLAIWPHAHDWVIDNRDRSRWFRLWRRLQAIRR